MSEQPEGIDVDLLVSEAWRAREGAYAPYSNFLVGAAALAGDRIVRGANVENASYPVAICAERVAASQAVASGARDIRAIAVTSSAPGPATPCGMCRQFLFEFNPDMLVISEGVSGERKAWRLADLLLDGFGPADLESAAEAT
ncbi:MAG TPA: cytidine deaminase [Actinomycetota bacterium]|nr:cytidine deaminase [Actinomycetota bacterium]